MANVDVSKPVIINATTRLNVQTDFFLRRVCFVSCGETSFPKGSYNAVTKGIYQDYVASNSQLFKEITAFFNYATNKEAYILELGAFNTQLYSNELSPNPSSPNIEFFSGESYPFYIGQGTTATISKENVATPQSTIATHGNNAINLVLRDGEGNYTLTLEKNKQRNQISFYVKKQRNVPTGITKEVLVLRPTETAQFSVVNMTSVSVEPATGIVNVERINNNRGWKFTAVGVGEAIVTLKSPATQNADEGIQKLRIIVDEVGSVTINKREFEIPAYLSSLLEITKPQNATQMITSSDPSIFTYDEATNLLKSTGKSGEAELIITTNVGGNADEIHIPVRVSKQVWENGEVDTRVDDFAKWLNKGLERAYWFVLPSNVGGFKDSDKLASIILSYSNPDSATYFVLTPSQDTDPTTMKVQGQKGAILVWDSQSEADRQLGLGGAIAGKFASYLFDLGPNNPASPLNFKQLNGFPFNSLESQFKKALIDNNFSFLDELAGVTTLLNGRCGDGKAIDYWYQWDLTQYYVEQALISIILNGVNNPPYAIRYDQNGIDTLQASIEATLTKMVNWNILTQFAGGVDTATGALVNSGHISSIGFYDYIAQNPEDYQNEVYQGFSAYLLIGKYIRQVVFAVTLS